MTSSAIARYPELVSGPHTDEKQILKQVQDDKPKKTRKFTKTLVLAMLLFPITLHAQQTFRWGVQLGSTDNDVVADIVPVKNGLIATGTFGGNLQCGQKTAEGHGGTDIFVMKLDKKGKPDWIRSLGGTENDKGTCIATDGEQVFAGGIINGTVTLEKDEYEGDGTAVMVSSWNLNGKLNWLGRLPYTGHATMDVIQLYPNGSILAGGMLQGTINTGTGELKTPGRKLAWHVLLNPKGSVQSAYLSSGSGNHRLKASALDSQGNRYFLYSTNGGMNFGAGNTVKVKSGSKAAVILVKQDNSGNFQWGKPFSSTGFCETAGLAIGEKDDIRVSLNFNKELTTPDTLIICKPQLKGVLFSLDQNGEKNWIKTVESPINARILDVLVNQAGNTLITGIFRHKLKAGEFEFTSNSSYGDLFLLQYNKEGKLNWKDMPAQDAANFCNTFALDDDGNILLGGGFRDELDFQGGIMKALGKKDAFIAKYFNCGQLELEIGNAGPLCDNEQRFLLATPGFESYLWNGNDFGNDSYEITSPGTYTLTAYTKQGCAVYDTVTVKPALGTDIGLGGPVTLYPGDIRTLTANEGFAYYKWNDGIIDRERDIKYREDTGDHYLWLTAQTESGCEVVDSVFVAYKTKPQDNMLKVQFALKVYPNPVKDFLYWKSALDVKGGLEISLHDGKSTRLYRKEITGYKKWQEHAVDMTGYPPGQYTFTIKTGHASYSEKIIKAD